MDSSTSPAPCAAAPDWSKQTEEVHCPLCGYNLRGLTEPRCPECGYQFEWIKLTDPSQRVHPYLFEHHPERNITSLVQTLAGSALPIRFWTHLHPQQASRPRRLLIYWLINLTMILIAAAALATPFLVEYHRRADFQRTQIRNALLSMPAEQRTQITSGHGSVEGYLDAYIPRPFDGQVLGRTFRRLSRHMPLIVSGVAYLLWPCIGMVVLNVFQQSMHKARIRSSHIMRCLVYSTDATIPLLAAAVLALLIGGFFWFHGRLPPVWMFLGWLRTTGLVVLPIVWLVASWRLIVAYRRYLQFPHAVAVVLVSELILGIAILVSLTVVMQPDDVYRLLYWKP